MRHEWMATGVLAAVLGACGGAGREPAASVAPAPGPPPAAETAHTPPTDITVCVVQDGELRRVRAQYDPRTGDTVVDGRPFAAAYPDTIGYAAGAEWYANDEPMMLNGRRHVKYGVPRVIEAHLLTRAGEYRGVPVFVEAGAGVNPDIKYVPVRPGCQFQPYDGHANVGAVRG